MLLLCSTHSLCTTLRCCNSSRRHIEPYRLQQDSRAAVVQTAEAMAWSERTAIIVDPEGDAAVYRWTGRSRRGARCKSPNAIEPAHQFSPHFWPPAVCCMLTGKMCISTPRIWHTSYCRTSRVCTLGGKSRNHKTECCDQFLVSLSWCTVVSYHH